eukprot:CAMPEP_0117648000 /NCGR_PEP_ID=MMETSP0804-20121206/151_1 /TAXON_ID=1074897 /ORGANISM="Tetraselmis astigmatica, Strain CCMP880" /LENGTH=34 /DNA_ID= /DNA_START= /DNA_END= /DNA_ORIENTATION=
MSPTPGTSGLHSPLASPQLCPPPGLPILPLPAPP